MHSPPTAWTEAQLDDSILKLCDEFPYARMSACSRALEHCRRMVAPGTSESLLTAMRENLRQDADGPCDAYVNAA